MPPPTQVHKGTLVNKDGKLIFQTKFSKESPQIDVPIEEILEDFENQGVEITLSPRAMKPPIYEGLVANWETQIEKVPDPDYQFCSEEGREKFLDMKLGLFVHWGMYSHLGTTESWAANASNAPQWFLDTYYTLYQMWNPTDFDAEEWVKVVKKAGMQFLVVTTKHHEGFCLFDTKTKTKARRRIGHLSNVVVNPVEDCEINFSVMDTPFKRDIIKELSDAFRKHDLGFGIYFSHIDWNDPNFRWDAANRSYDPNYNPKDNPTEWKAFIKRERDQLTELLSNYGPLDQIFFDGSWMGLAWDDMKKLVKELRKLQPNCMFNDRGTGPYGDFTCPERWVPKGTSEEDSRVSKKDWQVCDCIGTHWSYVPSEVYKDKKVLLRMVIDIVAKGGTILLDSGPMPHGLFAQEMVDVISYIGRWFQVNGEAIYATRFRDPYKEGENVYFTRSKDNKTLYLIHVGWPMQKVEVTSAKPKAKSQIFMLGVKEPLQWKHDGKKLTIEIPPALNDKIPCEYAYSFKIEV